jgi:2-polyprenyl-3-methyl-5-hydroxy-6-metoxy-1,4-benzoquinol methylase
MTQWYEELFRDYAEKYENEAFTKGSLGEVDFIEQEISKNKDTRILDIGCGTGRHSIELAKRGYAVTGIDLSESLLSKANRTSRELKLNIDFIRKDARDFNFNERFGLAIMICEGAFPLMETDEMNCAILKNAFLSIKSGGKFIFTTLNGLFPLFHSVKEFMDKNATDGTSSENSFDLMTFRDHSVYETTDDNGNAKVLHCNERYYVPSEINWLLRSIGFRKVDIYGCKLGAFSRNDKLTTEDFEMLVIAEK